MTAWQVIGYIGEGLFGLAIVAILIADRLLRSPRKKIVELGEAVFGGLGGPKIYRETKERHTTES